MVACINNLIEIIQLSQEQLKRRISLRTDELERLSKLNKNFIYEMNQQKNIEFELLNEEKKLYQIAYYDPLTNLPNQQFFNKKLNEKLVASKEEHMNLALLFVDIDKFNHINQGFGHDVGDLYLIHIAKCLSGFVRSNDLVARFFEDRFMIAIFNVPNQVFLKNFTEQLMKILSLPLIFNDEKIVTTVSIGISLYPRDGNSVEALEKKADIALDQAKNAGGNTYQVYDQSN